MGSLPPSNRASARTCRPRPVSAARLPRFMIAIQTRSSGLARHARRKPPGPALAGPIMPAEKQSPHTAHRRMRARFPPARAGNGYRFFAFAAFAVSARIFSTRST